MEIYKITNKLNSKIYIGKTVHTSLFRWQQHLYESYNKNDPAYNFYFHKAIRKYGADAFIVETIDYTETEQELNLKEKYWTKYFLNLLGKEMLYNIAEGGNGGRTRGSGWHHTEEAKKKMSEAQKKVVHKRNVYHHSEETKLKISKANAGKNNGMFGKHHSAETKKILSEATHKNKLGTKSSEATRKKLSESHKGIFKGRISIHKDSIVKYVFQDQLDEYLNTGWIRGTGRFKNK